MVNVNSDIINPLYKEYYKKNKIPDFCPLSDEERYFFEREIILKFYFEFMVFYGAYFAKMNHYTILRIEHHLSILDYDNDSWY